MKALRDPLRNRAIRALLLLWYGFVSLAFLFSVAKQYGSYVKTVLFGLSVEWP